MQNRMIYGGELNLHRPDNTFKAAICCCYFSGAADYEKATKYLHTEEYNYYTSLKYEKRIRNYLLGRFIAKQAISTLTGERDLASINVQSGIFTQPIVVSNWQNVQVSITHCDDFGAALAFPEQHPMGIDLEKIDPHKREAMERQMTVGEKRRIGDWSLSYDEGLTLLWTAKEALSKVLKTGLMTPFEIFEISRIEPQDNSIISYYKNFTQYKVSSFSIAEYLCSIAYPIKTELIFDFKSLKANFAYSGSFDDVKGIAL